MNNKTTTSIIALSALIVTFAMPGAFAGAGTVENYYWQSDPEVCYTSQLDDIDIDGSTGNQSTVETELDKIPGNFNPDMGSRNIDSDDGSCPSIHYINMESEALGNFGYTALTSVWVYSSDTTKMHHTVIEFTTDRGFGSDVNVCANQNKDIEWTGNHEMGHSVGLKHHFHLFTNDSVMEPNCVSSWAAVQSLDATALDIKY